MKKVLLSVALLVISSFTAVTFAQTATANLSITLSDVSSISITGSPSITFDTEAKYANGASAAVDDHLDILSSRKYKVTVEAGTITGPGSLTAGTVQVQAAAAAASGNYTGIASYPSITLDATAADFITSTASSFDATHTHTKFKVTYTAGTNQAYIGKTGSATPNVVPVIYTLIQQ